MVLKNLVIAAVAMTATASLAAPKNVTLSHGGAVTHFTGATKGAGTQLHAVRHPGATIFSNLTTPYNSGNGWTISATGSVLSSQQWIAQAFTPSANATVKEIDVAVGYVTGANGVTVGLYTNNNGVPGTKLWSKNLKNLPAFGTCCDLGVGKLKGGVAVKKGTSYFVAVTTSKKTKDTWDAWNFTNDNSTAIPAASNSGSGWNALGGGLSPAGAFAVYD